MDEQYLTEDIVIKKRQLYYKDKLIKRHNWHLKLRELGWEKLHKHWITKLNKLHNPYPNNSLFGCLECGDDGDCLFHCISHSLNSVDKEMYDSGDIREIIADSITEELFKDIISCYRCMKDLDDFNESWDPYEIDTLDDFKKEICKSGHSYWGDHLLIQLIVKQFKNNIFILSQNEFDDIYEPYPIGNCYNKDLNSIILVHENNSHFKLLGHFDDIMITNFDDSTLPLEIKRLFDL